MLVLSRRVGEQICIGEGIVVSVVAVQGGKVRLGIQAPPDVAVDRQEVRIRKEWPSDCEELVPLVERN